MNVFAISDLHLSTTNPDKDMAVFGENWRNHHVKIHYIWKKTIKEDDVVLIPGDICWALKMFRKRTSL